MPNGGGYGDTKGFRAAEMDYCLFNQRNAPEIPTRFFGILVE